MEELYGGMQGEQGEKFAALLERKAEEEVHPEDMESVQRFCTGRNV